MKTKILLTSALLLISSSLASTVTIDCKPEGLKFANGTYVDKWHTNGCRGPLYPDHTYEGCYDGNGESERSVIAEDGNSFLWHFTIEHSVDRTSWTRSKELIFNLGSGTVLMCRGGKSCYEVAKGACSIKIVSD